MTPDRRYCAVVEYDGTDFLGFQVQATGRTVQGELERSIEHVSQRTIRVDAAGRTDAGVHALGQVVAFNTGWKHGLTDLHRALNATLPGDIVVRSLVEAHSDFHPRFGAISRTYRYKILNQQWPSAVHRNYMHHVREDLDIAAMQQASQFLVGSHDFSSFGKPPQGNNAVRAITQAEWFFQDDNRLTFSITANAFLYRMVRRIVGTLVRVGVGIMDLEDVKSILEARDLSQSAPPVPACGLYLLKVIYPEGSLA